MAPVEQYDWEEVANELQAENDRLETALAQTRMRADKKLKQLNVLRDELAEFDAGERERAGGDEWFLVGAAADRRGGARSAHQGARCGEEDAGPAAGRRVGRGALVPGRR